MTSSVYLYYLGAMKGPFNQNRVYDFYLLEASQMMNPLIFRRISLSSVSGVVCNIGTTQCGMYFVAFVPNCGVLARRNTGEL